MRARCLVLLLLLGRLDRCWLLGAGRLVLLLWLLHGSGSLWWGW